MTSVEVESIVLVRMLEVGLVFELLVFAWIAPASAAGVGWMCMAE